MSAKVKAKRDYNDLQLNRLVKSGEVYDVSLERMAVLLNAGYVEVVETKVVKPQTEKKARVKKNQ